MKTVFTAGWNMPGYMPEIEPYEREDFETAREDICEELRRASDFEVATDEEAKPYLDALALAEKETEPFTVQAGKYVFWVERLEI